jgi:hypothetical protein
MSEKDNNESLNMRPNWVVVGESTSRIIAEFAVNGLKSYDIPAVLDSRPGILGTSGMIMPSLRSGKLEKFKILVPAEYEEEAKELVVQFLSGNNKTDPDYNSKEN